MLTKGEQVEFKSDYRWLRWETVKSVASNEMTRIVGLIPLAGYLILFNDEIAQLISFNTLAGLDQERATTFFLSSLAKLRLVFFGSLLVLIAFVIFKMFSPSALEHSKGELEFSARVKEGYSVYELASMESAVYADIWTPRTAAFWMVLGDIRSKTPVVSGFRPDVRQMMFGKHGDYIHFLACEWWSGQMNTFRAARIASIVTGVCGYLLLALPTLDIAQAVIRDIF